MHATGTGSLTIIEDSALGLPKSRECNHARLCRLFREYSAMETTLHVIDDYEHFLRIFSYSSH